VRTLFGCLVILASCDDGIEDPRAAQVVNVMAAADEPIIRARPRLAAGKYVKMAGGPYDFFRGTVPLYRSDLRTGATRYAASRFALDVPLVPSLGDPHPENFGILRAADGTPALEPNDFDASDREPYLWDVRRLAAGMALAAVVAKLGEVDAKALPAPAATAAAPFADVLARVLRTRPPPPKPAPAAPVEETTE